MKFTRQFNAETSTQFCFGRTYNEQLLISTNNYIRARLRSKLRVPVFLNDVYDDLGLPRSMEGQMYGWVFDENKDFPFTFVEDPLNHFTITFHTDGIIVTNMPTEEAIGGKVSGL